jgi:hypothetical protein
LAWPWGESEGFPQQIWAVIPQSNSISYLFRYSAHTHYLFPLLPDKYLT